ncbi:S8 family peptidase [Pyxidicoccus xibeiensis]|uniref:S8 family peptidase n=1 Tax=Pyxidicoccus xibeiensis TaxID=2906759 RepID=UPI0020A768C1|nr:S8 family peptidase [Pyxidicoccus xibeiensis]MCP3138229.1 S8 family peptidase [Pyxidicoccus xibeiensis]
MRRLLAVGLLALAACSSGDEPPLRTEPQQQATGRVQGQLTPFQGAGQQSTRGHVLPSGGPSLQEWSRLVSRATAPAPLPGPLGGASAEEDALPGEVIVRFAEPGLSAEQALQRVELPGYRAVHRGYASEYLHLVAFEPEGRSHRKATPAMTGQLVSQLAARPGVRFAEPNRRVRSHAVPNDFGFPFQWHYATLNLPAAWDVQVEAPGVVVAVLDTGIVFHPDLAARVLPGIDMVSDLANSGDGDGRDGDPTDPGGDLPGGGSSWHGTHVAGTIGALSNNGAGVAGVSWASQILPVRVLGQQGASSFDLAAAMYWAAGGSIPGLPPNPTPARVINLSLGGSAPPQQAYQEVIDDRVNAAGAIFVIAAGNESLDATGVSPCNQQNVLCVGSTTLVGRRSGFSNFGAPVDVMAPGGELRQDFNGDGYPDGVLSTALDAAGLPAYLFYEGTSMAAPHVAGVLALMLALRPELVSAEAERILKETAIPSSQCPEGCGAGLVNAQAALRALQGVPVLEPPRLTVNTPRLFFAGDGTLPLLLFNEGGGELVVTASADGLPPGLVTFPAGATVSVPTLGARPLQIAVTTAGLEPGDYLATITLTSASGTVPVELLLRVGVPSARDALVAFVYLDEQGNWQTAPELATVALAANGYRYAIDLPPRVYFATAAIDDNQNGVYFEDGERIGFWRNTDSVEPIEVRAGEVVDRIDFDLIPYIPVETAP